MNHSVYALPLTTAEDRTYHALFHAVGKVSNTRQVNILLLSMTARQLTRYAWLSARQKDDRLTWASDPAGPRRAAGTPSTAAIISCAMPLTVVVDIAFVSRRYRLLTRGNYGAASRRSANQIHSSRRPAAAERPSSTPPLRRFARRDENNRSPSLSSFALVAIRFGAELNQLKGLSAHHQAVAGGLSHRNPLLAMPMIQ